MFQVADNIIGQRLIFPLRWFFDGRNPGFPAARRPHSERAFEMCVDEKGEK